MRKRLMLNVVCEFNPPLSLRAKRSNLRLSRSLRSLAMTVTVKLNSHTALMFKAIALLCGMIWLGASVQVLAAALPEKSIYHFKQEWKNQNGKKQTLEAFKGKVRIVAMIYTSCSGACPLIVNTLKKIEKQLSPAELEKTGFVLFSMDPARDSPKVLKAFAKAHNIKKNNWVLLTSNKNNTQELATALDFNFKEGANGMFVHQNTIFVLDSNGVLIAQYPNLDEAVAGVQKALSQIPS